MLQHLKTKNRNSTILMSTLNQCALHFTALHYSALHRTAQHSTAPHRTALHCTVHQCIVLHYTSLHFRALFYPAIYFYVKFFPPSSEYTMLRLLALLGALGVIFLPHVQLEFTHPHSVGSTVLAPGALGKHLGRESSRGFQC
jgi:hypothetical protein